MRKPDYPHRKVYFDHLLFERGVSKPTVAGYNLDLELFFGYLEKENKSAALMPEQIEPIHILGFLTEMGSSRGNEAITRNRKLAALRSYFGYLERYGLLKGALNPVMRFQSVRTGKRLPVYFTVEEAEAFLEAAATGRYAHRDLAMFRLVLQTGCRVGELLSLTLDRLDLQQRSVRIIGKGDKERLIPLTAKTCKVLADYLQARRPPSQHEVAVFFK